jgi:single-stranded-DNA-specific exonuclease
VPLIGENRIFVRAGLKHLRESKWAGLVALGEVAQIKRDPTPADVGFRLGPRLNASGRLDDASLSLNLLKTDVRTEAMRIARELDAHNRERQRIEQQTFDEAIILLERDFNPESDRSIVLAQRGWHVGVIGIVASRVQRMHHRPTFIIGINDEGMGKGSGRSIDGCSLIGGLKNATHLLEVFGGHEMAAGLSVREENVVAFRTSLNAWVTEHVAEECFHPVLSIDAALEIAEVTPQLLEDLEMLTPFGRENPQPVFEIGKVRHRREPQRFGRNHVKFFPSGGMPDLEAVAFGLGDRPLPQGEFSLAGVVEHDDFRGTVQIRVLDWREN